MQKKKLSLKLLSFLMAAMMVFSAAYIAPEYSTTAIVAEAAKAKTVSISKTKIKLSATTMNYTGKALKPSVKVTYGKKTLKSGKNYTVKYSNNKNIGVAKVTITGVKKGGYTGSKTLTFKILPAKVSGLKVSSFDTSSATLKWSSVKGAQGYYVYSYNTKTKKYTKVATVKKNTATIKKLSKGVEYVYTVKAYKTVSKKTYTSAAYSSTVKVCTVPAAPTVTAKAGKNSVTLKWKAAVGAANYEVYIYDAAAKKYYSLGNTEKAKNKLTYTVKNLDKSTYSFAVRAYKMKGKKKVYSSYSKVVKSTVTSGSYNIDAVANAFKAGNYQMSITMKDEEMGDSEVTIASKKNGDLAVNTTMKGVDIRFVYTKGNNKTYLIVKIAGVNWVVDNVPQDDFNFGEISSSISLGDIQLDNVQTKVQFVGSKRYDIDYSVDENGNTTEYWFLNGKLVKINNIDKNGKTEATDIKDFKTSPSSGLFKVAPNTKGMNLIEAGIEKAKWKTIDYSKLEDILGGLGG